MNHGVCCARRMWLVAAVMVTACNPFAVRASQGEQTSVGSEGQTAASRPALEDRKLPGRDDRSAPVTLLEQWARPALALGLVIALILVLRYLLRRWAKGTAGLSGAGAIEVVGRAALPPRGQLLLVRLGRRLVLVATWHGGATALSEVTDPAEVAELTAAAGKGSRSVVTRTVTKESSGERDSR